MPKPTFETKSLQRHFLKHGLELNVTSAADYEAKAQKFLERTPGGCVHVGVDRQGDSLMFDDRTNEFAVLGADNDIKTYHVLKPYPNKTALQRFREKTQR